MRFIWAERIVPLPVPLKRQFQPSICVFFSHLLTSRSFPIGTAEVPSEEGHSCRAVTRPGELSWFHLLPFHPSMALEHPGLPGGLPVYGSRIKMCLTGCLLCFISHFLGSLTTPGTLPGPCAFSAAVSDIKHKSELGMGPCSAELQGRGMWMVL